MTVLFPFGTITSWSALASLLTNTDAGWQTHNVNADQLPRAQPVVSKLFVSYQLNR